MIFDFSKTHQRKHVEIASIFHPSKLYRKITSKWKSSIRPLILHQKTPKTKQKKNAWRRNSLILTCHRNFNIGSTWWLCCYNIGTKLFFTKHHDIRTHLILETTQNQHCFSAEFYRWVNVEKSTSNQRGYHVGQRHNGISAYINAESTLNVCWEEEWLKKVMMIFTAWIVFVLFEKKYLNHTKSYVNEYKDFFIIAMPSEDTKIS